LDLESLGWDESFADAFRPFEHDGLAPARVAVEHRTEYIIYTQHGELRAELAGRLRHDEEQPAVGDWVAVALRLEERRATIHAVLPRRSSFTRKASSAEGRLTQQQVVAANVDVVFVVCGLDMNYNVRRIERYLTLAWESGAQPIVLLTKADLCDDVDARVYEVESIAIGVPVHSVSAPLGDGVESVRAYVTLGKTAALLGSSGVGKSTLVNALVGEELLATQDVREDGRGRHTTSHRQLVPLPEGGLVLDTPGMRELQLWDADTGLEAAFQDLETLAGQCRFADCAHRREPGCAVRAALADGTLDVERLESWRKLQRELERLASKQDGRARSESRKERARFARSMRKTSY
jgi:ribosome biogenesis GTPase